MSALHKVVFQTRISIGGKLSICNFPPSAAGAKNELTCITCKIVIDTLRDFITDPVNEEAVSTQLRKLCDVLFANDALVHAQCDAMIGDYTDDIIELLVNEYLEPEKFCTMLNICP